MYLENTKLLLEEKYNNNEFSSYAVLVYKKGEKEVIMSPDVDEYTYFDVASTGKVLVTSTLILQAIDRGLLNFENTLQDFFANVTEDKRNITVKHLLTHTSGIVRYQLTEKMAENGIDSVAEEILSYPLAYETGKNYIYSCNGYILLGFILEKIYGKTLEEIYRNNIAEPLGIKRTSFEIDMDEPNAAICYRWKRTESTKHRFDDENILVLGKSAGSGGQQSCLHDIEKFVDAVINKDDRLYSKSMFDIAEKNYTPDYSTGRGLGYLVVDENYKQTGNLFPIGSFGHCGHAGQSFFISREQDMYVIILTNATRHLNMKNNFNGYNYDEIMKLRKDIHNEISIDLLSYDA